VKTRKHSRWREGIYDSEIEIVATKTLYDNGDKWLHILIADCKGSENICLLSDKPKD
jgi:hypothetical protein